MVMVRDPGSSYGGPEDVRPAMTPRVTDREWQVLRLRALGYTAHNIGVLLFISESTVKNHLATSYRKLEANCLVDALRAVGWLEVPE